MSVLQKPCYLEVLGLEQLLEDDGQGTKDKTSCSNTRVNVTQCDVNVFTAKAVLHGKFQDSNNFSKTAAK